jgi:hypothetical protein
VTASRREITVPAHLAGALSGVLAAAVALGVAQLVAGITGALGRPKWCVVSVRAVGGLGTLPAAGARANRGK